MSALRWDVGPSVTALRWFVTFLSDPLSALQSTRRVHYGSTRSGGVGRTQRRVHWCRQRPSSGYLNGLPRHCWRVVALRLVGACNRKGWSTVPYALSPCPAIRAGDTVRYSPWGRDDTAEATVVVFIVGRVGNGSRGVLRRRFALLRCSDGVLDHTVLMGRQPKCALTFLVGREDGFNFQLSDIERAFLVRSKVHHLSKAEQRLSSTDRKEKRKLEQKTYRTGVVHAKVQAFLRDPSDEGYTSSNDECESSKPNRQEWGQSSLN